LSGFRFRAGCGFQRKPHIWREFFPNIFPGCHQLGALFNERIETTGIFVSHVPRRRKYVAILLQRATRGNPRATVFGSLHDQDANG